MVLELTLNFTLLCITKVAKLALVRSLLVVQHSSACQLRQGKIDVFRHVIT